jgi:type IV secretion system protein VirB11
MEVIETRFSPGSDGLLAPLKPFLENKGVSEILINKPKEVFVECQGMMEQHIIPALDGRHLAHLFGFIANENRSVLNTANPILSGSLTDGSRVQLVITPAAKYPALSIRRTSIKKMTLDDYRGTAFYSLARSFQLEKANKMSSDNSEQELRELYQQEAWADFITLAVQLKKNIVISGATSSGKTTFLNACTAHIPQHERIVTLEDTFEVDIPHANVVSLLAPKRGEGKVGELTMQDLVQCALRLRPDRIIMGEIRGREILDFISACSTGHEGSITSIHANDPRMAFMRMAQMYKLNNVPSMRDEDIQRELHSVIDIVVQLQKTQLGRQLIGVYYKHEKH